MEDIRHRAAQLAVELLSLQKRVGQEASDIADAATRDLLRELKSSVDSVRHLLRRVVDAEPVEPESPRSLVEQVTEIVDRHTRSQSNAA
jgi:molecular chaperone GrpE (heat shock protein)